MNRVMFLVLGTIAIICVATVTVQAAAIPMAYNNSTNTVLLDWDMEGDGAPTVGSVTYTNTTGVVTGGGSEPDAYEGSNMLKSYRYNPTTSAHVDFGSLPGASDAITMTMAFRCEDSLSYFNLYPGTDGSGGDKAMAGFSFTGTGVFAYHNDGWVFTDLTHDIGAWNELVLTHTNGTGDWTVSVNGSSLSFTITDGATWPEYLGVLGGVDVYNGNYPSTVYMDAVPGTFIYGDANQDNKVDKADAAILAANWLSTDMVNWGKGDFNEDGIVDDKDATWMATNWSHGTVAGSSVPEPGTIGLLLAALVLLVAVRYTRRR